MSFAELPVTFQDLPDGPGELGQRDDGKVPVWSFEDRRLIMLPLPQPADHSIVVRGGGGGGGGSGVTDHALLSNLDYASAGHTGFAQSVHTHAIADASDFTDTTGAGTDAYAIVWDNGTSKFILSAVASGGTPGGSTTHVQYNSAGAFAGDSGFVYAGSGVAALTGRLVVPVIRPPSDGTTALVFQNSSGTPIISLDSSGNILAFTAATAQFDNGQFLRGLNASAVSGRFIGVEAGNAVVFGDLDNRFGEFHIRTGSNTTRMRFDSASDRITIGGGTFTSNDYNLSIRINGAARKGFVVLANSGQTANLIDVMNSSANTTFFGVGADGTTTIRPIVAATSTITDALIVGENSSGTPAAGFGVGLSMQIKSSTSNSQNAARITTSWLDATHATRGSRSRWSSYYTTTENIGVTIGSNSSGALLSFYDVTTPIARQVLATGAGATVDNVISALQALGLLKQS